METDQSQSAMKPTLATNQEEEQQDLDFISLLPDETLHTILSKLEIRDAAVTTAVSKRWAPLFPTLPSLKIFVDSFLILHPYDDYDSYDDYYMDNKIKWVDSLISVLDSRKTDIKKFDIEVNLRELDADVFYPVFSCLCFAGVKELSIFNSGTHNCYQIPTPVFSCNTIVKLESSTCKLVVPSKLTGLRSVKSLVLTNVTVADDDLQRMISRCKAMEKLSIIDCLMVKNIVICAPSLSELEISLGWPVGVVLKNVPLLVSMEISFDSISDTSMKCCYDCLEEKGSDIDEESDGSFFSSEGTDDEEIDGGFSVINSEKIFEETNEATNLMDILNGLHYLKDLRLKFSNGYRMIFSKEGMALPNCYMVKLKKLCLCFPFNYNNFNMSISCLLNSSPHLMEIIICVDEFYYSKDSPNALELNFWEKQLPAECVKHHLKTATFYLGYLSEDCFGFPKFLLRNAGNLKNMKVFYYGKLKRIPNTSEKIKRELFAIQMASPDVEIMVKPIISSHIPSF